jgi:hypothetical protein
MKEWEVAVLTGARSVATLTTGLPKCGRQGRTQ